MAPGANVAYDVLVAVGVSRFLQCRQLQEIQADLSRSHGVEIPVRTLGYLARKFVAYVQLIHEQSVPQLCRAMRKRGGFVLHIDGTCEEGSRVLLVCMDSLSGQILDSRKIASESNEEVRGPLEDVREQWGTPLAVVHDLRRSLINAAGEVFPEVPQFVCHYHLAADVGKDILNGHVDRLRRLFRRTKLRPRLGALCRSLREFAAEAGGDPVVSSLLDCRIPQEIEDRVTPNNALGTVHALVSWILAFSRAGDGYGFPFELPYLVLYDRVVEVHRVLRGISATWPRKGKGAMAKLSRLDAILSTVVEGEYAEEFDRIVSETRRDQAIFERFRAALRICPRRGKRRRNDDGEPKTLSPARHQKILNHLRSALEQRSRRDKGAATACRIVIDHLDKYWSFLFGHRIKSQPHPVVVPRTNNDEERFFRMIKRQCRRLHGRGHLSRDVNEMPAGTPLVQNLKNAEYCATVYGGPDQDRIATRFAEVDPRLPLRVMQGWKRDRLTTRLPSKLERMVDLPERLAPFLTAATRDRDKQA